MGRFAAAYRRHFGGTESATQLYSGFAAFFAGAAMGLIGILVVLSGDFLIESTFERYQAGILIAALGMPLLFMGLQLTLPSRIVIHTAAGLGAAVCIIAAFMFLHAYPAEWGPRAAADRSNTIIATYTVGLVLLFTTTAMALVVNFVSRHVALPGREDEFDPFADPNRPVSMEEVMRDIEREVSRQKLTWGGMDDRDRLPKQFVKLGASFGEGATVSSGRAGKVTETYAEEMDHAFTSLARLRGTKGKGESEDDTATAIDALRALRRARQAELEASWWYRFKRWLVTLFTGGRKRTSPQTAPTPPAPPAPPAALGAEEQKAKTKTPAPANGVPSHGTRRGPRASKKADEPERLASTKSN